MLVMKKPVFDFEIRKIKTTYVFLHSNYPEVFNICNN